MPRKCPGCGKRRNLIYEYCLACQSKETITACNRCGSTDRTGYNGRPAIGKWLCPPCSDAAMASVFQQGIADGTFRRL